MSSSLSHGILTLSIEVETGAAPLDVRDQRSLGAIVGRLLEILAKHQVPATWALADPAASMATASIQSIHVGHEIAIAGDASWAGPIVPRLRFGRELASRTIAGRAAGLTLTSLVVRSANLGDHYDLVVKQGLTAVRHAGAGQATRRAAGRKGVLLGLDCGVLAFPAGCPAPAACGQAAEEAARRVRRSIARFASRRWFSWPSMHGA